MLIRETIGKNGGDKKKKGDEIDLEKVKALLCMRQGGSGGFGKGRVARDGVNVDKSDTGLGKIGLVSGIRRLSKSPQ